MQDRERFKRVISPYKKVVHVVNGPGGRFYVTPERNRYPSITTVLSSHGKEALDKWRKKVGHEVAEKIGKQARDRGDYLHDISERYIKGAVVSELLPEYPLKIRTMFGGIKQVLDNNLTEVHLQEQAIYSDVLRLAGRLDLLGMFDGKLSVIDFKGSTKHKREEWIEHYFMQASGYAFMYYEQTLVPVTQVVIVIAYEDGSIDVFRKNPSQYLGALRNEVIRYEKTMHPDNSLTGSRL